jgi:hypothetical protein
VDWKISSNVDFKQFCANKAPHRTAIQLRSIAAGEPSRVRGFELVI